MQTDYPAIIALLSDYFDGLYHSDSQLLASVFHPSAQYFCASDGSLFHLTMQEYFPIVAQRESPASRHEARRDRILSIELAGPVTAFARLECAIGPKFFTDLLTLIKLEGRWQIISKVFHYDLQPLPG
ncbi:nuclear transport factor 2 family protein [Undibacterium sp.]|uniref:nuclear transport factor 2 family protein n=1 Tax=Undibacterium sp. TaxID=1914977 RepID=UPI0025D3949E|nr:nuclear transport factor 2 family protein [Undibacterium sp.]